MKTEKKIIYVDMDGVLSDYEESFSRMLKANPKIQFPQSQYGFFRKLKLIQGAKEGISFLNQLQEFEVYILTAPSVNNPLCYTEKREWIENNLGFEMVKKLIISPNKGLNKGTYLIDDHVSGRGQEKFEGKVLEFGSKEFPGWREVCEYFEQKYG